jgi:hypothetical protein
VQESKERKKAKTTKDERRKKCVGQIPEALKEICTYAIPAACSVIENAP